MDTTARLLLNHISDFSNSFVEEFTFKIRSSCGLDSLVRYARYTSTGICYFLEGRFRTVTPAKVGNGCLKSIHLNICAILSIGGCHSYISLRILFSGGYNRPQDSLNKTKQHVGLIQQGEHMPEVGQTISQYRIAATAILSVIIAGVAVWNLKPTPPQEPKQVTRFEYELPEGQLFSASESGLPLLTVSPDGSKFVYCTNKGLFLRSMNDLDAQFITGTDENSIQPFFSPDGKWIGYWSGTDQKLKKVAASGGAPVLLCDAQSAGGFSWGPDNRILHGVGENIMWVSDKGGNWQPLIEQKGGLLGYPQMLPGGEFVIYVNFNTSPYRIMVYSIKTGESKELLEGLSALYLKSGYIVYGVGNGLNIVQFDKDALELTGDRIPLVADVSNNTYSYYYGISDSGTLVYIPGTYQGSTERTLVWVDRKGNEEPIAAKPNDYGYVKLSPDGTRAALSIYTPGHNEDLWICDLARGTFKRLTFDEANAGESVWTPDGERIIFAYRFDKYYGIYSKSEAGTGKADPIYSLPNGDIWPKALLSDGKTLLFGQYIGSDQGNDNIGILYLERDPNLKLLLHEKYAEFDPHISKDGRWLAYVVYESGHNEVYVRSFPDVTKERKQISTDGGNSPLWSPDGRELFYRCGDSFMAVEIETEPFLNSGKPTALFKGNYASRPNLFESTWDIHPFTKKFLMMKPYAGGEDVSTSGSTSKIIVVTNWFEELKQKVPVHVQ